MSVKRRYDPDRAEKVEREKPLVAEFLRAKVVKTRGREKLPVSVLYVAYKKWMGCKKVNLSVDGFGKLVPSDKYPRHVAYYNGGPARCLVGYKLS